jgi:hypothetical protein
MDVLPDNWSTWGTLKFENFIQKLCLRHKEKLPVGVSQHLEVFKDVHDVGRVDGGTV